MIVFQEPFVTTLIWFATADAEKIPDPAGRSPASPSPPRSPIPPERPEGSAMRPLMMTRLSELSRVDEDAGLFSSPIRRPYPALRLDGLIVDAPQVWAQLKMAMDRGMRARRCIGVHFWEARRGASPLMGNVCNGRARAL